MATTPYPLPKSTRQSAVLLGDGSTTYGPFGDGWGIFDLDDVLVETRLAAAGVFVEAAITVAKVNPAAAYGAFNVTFPAAITSATEFRVTGSRLHERELAVTRGGAIDGVALEKELSKQSVVLQELRRDVTGQAPPADRANAIVGYDSHGAPISYAVSELFSGAFDARGPFAGRAAYDAQAAGFTYLDTDSRPLVFYIRDTAVAGVWAGPFYFGLTASTGLGFDYPTRADAIAATIPAAVIAINVLGHTTAGVGGAIYKEVADTGTLEAWQFRSNGNTRRWQISEPVIDVKMLNAPGDGTADDAPAFISAFAALPATGGVVDARSLAAVKLTANIFAGLAKPVTVIFGPGTVTLTASQNLTGLADVKIYTNGTVFNSTSAITMFNATNSVRFEFRGNGRLTGTPTAGFDVTGATAPHLEFADGLTSGSRVIPAWSASDSLEGVLDKYMLVKGPRMEAHSAEVFSGEYWVVVSGKRTAQTGVIRLPQNEAIKGRRADDVNDIDLLQAGPASRAGFILIGDSGAQGLEILNRLLSITDGTAPNIRPAMIQVGAHPNRGLKFDMQGTGALEINNGGGSGGLILYDGAGVQLFRSVPNSGFIMGQNHVVKRVAVAYGASITINAQLGNEFDITATNGTAFTINAPSAPIDGERITITIINGSGGALGAITWNAVFKMDAWASPGNGNNRSIDFRYDGTSWHEVSRSAQNIPN